jgi:energy-coupling factor transporter ATP-binding protein EcfA2
MIINIRGTSGSGKSTLVRSIRALYKGPTLKYHEPGRKQPLGYLHHRAADQGSGPPLGLVGHYETDCGGCDTIPKMERIFELVLQAHGRGMDVIFEGLLISADVNRTVELFNAAGGHQLQVIALDVPIEECLDSVNARRRAKDLRRGATEMRPEVNPKNTISKHKGVKQSCVRLAEAGVPVWGLGRVDAYNKIKELLNL